MIADNHRHYFLSSLEKIVDFLLNFTSAYVTYFIALFFYPNELVLTNVSRFMVISVVCAVASFMYYHHDLYRPMRTRRPRFFFGRIFLVNVELTGLVVALIVISSVEEVRAPILWISLAALTSLVLLYAKKVIMISVLRRMRANKRNIKHVLLVTDSQAMADAYMEEILNNPHFGYSVIGYVGNLNIIGLPHIGTTGELDRILKEYRPDEVILAFDTVRKKVITKYLSICNNNCAKVMVVPAICGYFRSPKQVTEIGNLPVIDIRSTPQDNPGNQLAKRLLDIVGSSILIILTSPLMLFTAIGVKLSSPGPILFRQTRVGKNNREFTMYKFRSMRVNNSEQTGWSTENDPRKTRFGAFIRKVALDELPQFFNVLKGDMSLVGPRPEVPFYVEKFKKEIPLYMLKHTLRPGITGLAQIKGLRGDTSIQARIDEDIHYIENWTFWLDLQILFLTPFCAFNRHEKFAARDEHEKKKQEAKGPRPTVEEDDNDDE